MADIYEIGAGLIGFKTCRFSCANIAKSLKQIPPVSKLTNVRQLSLSFEQQSKSPRSADNPKVSAISSSDNNRLVVVCVRCDLKSKWHSGPTEEPALSTETLKLEKWHMGVSEIKGSVFWVLIIRILLLRVLY